MATPRRLVTLPCGHKTIFQAPVFLVLQTAYVDGCLQRQRTTLVSQQRVGVSSNTASARLGCLRDCNFSIGWLPTITNGVFSLKQSSVLQTEVETTGQVWIWASHHLLWEGKACLGMDTGAEFMSCYVSPCVVCLWHSLRMKPLYFSLTCTINCACLSFLWH